MEKLLSINEVCEILSISRGMFYKILDSDNPIKIIKIGTRTLVSPGELNKWINRNER